MELIKKLKIVRINKHISKKKLSRLTGFSVQQISNFENGNKVPEDKDLIVICNCLEISKAKLLDEEYILNCSKENKKILTTIICMSIITAFFIFFLIPFVYTWKYKYPNTNPGEPDKVWYFINILGIFLESGTNWTLKIIPISFYTFVGLFLGTSIANLLWHKKTLFVLTIISFSIAILISFFIILLLLI